MIVDPQFPSYKTVRVACRFCGGSGKAKGLRSRYDRRKIARCMECDGKGYAEMIKKEPTK